MYAVCAYTRRSMSIRGMLAGRFQPVVVLVLPCGGFLFWDRERGRAAVED